MAEIDEKIKSFKNQLDKFGIEVIQAFHTKNYGPFDFLNEISPTNVIEHDRFLRKFKDGIYAIATAKSETEPVCLFHLDESKKKIRIQRPIRFLVGRKDDSDTKSSLMVYIPKQYMNHLRKALKSGDKNDMDNAMKAHDLFYVSFYRRLSKLTKTYLETFYSKRVNLRELALNGNRRYQVPSEILEAIKRNKISPKMRNFPIGTYEVHREDIELPDGQRKIAVLTITTRFNGSVVKHFKKTDYTISQTTENYSIFYNLSIK